jgi:hypothetical protein
VQQDKHPGKSTTYNKSSIFGFYTSIFIEVYLKTPASGCGILQRSPCLPQHDSRLWMSLSRSLSRSQQATRPPKHAQATKQDAFIEDDHDYHTTAIQQYFTVKRERDQTTNIRRRTLIAVSKRHCAMEVDGPREKKMDMQNLCFNSREPDRVSIINGNSPHESTMAIFINR